MFHLVKIHMNLCTIPISTIKNVASTRNTKIDVVVPQAALLSHIPLLQTMFSVFAPVAVQGMNSEARKKSFDQIPDRNGSKLIVVFKCIYLV